ncbi:DUF6688 domain-containing protein [Lewinella cohaerens]|uniref:DUF6688 domain-containing protein n=1 Tax=Lewinella cohaerens TaxID=70995 RepID=UPI0003646E71|nr:DUF6688 family protein [Lewinella cohaerens]
MELLFVLPVVLVVLIGASVALDFMYYCINGKRLFRSTLSRTLEVLVVLGFPLLYLGIFDFEQDNDCCSDSAVFSPEHRLTIYVWIVLSAGAFFYSAFRKQLAPPLLEVIVNCLLLLGIVLNFFIAFQGVLSPVTLGHVPIVLLFLLLLSENQKAVLRQTQDDLFSEEHKLTAWANHVLRLPIWAKYPVLIIICLPVILVVTAILLLFGQQPDSSIRAFTDTYKHGFSQWDYMCDNVQCGGHFLCSVAAQGHPNIVRPERLGVRHGQLIVCNRQLLIANAFEEVITEQFPRLHRLIRRNYNRVGDMIHRYYYWFENKYISDAIYYLMKPLEWCFWVYLYLTDRQPEDRIARQYL